jgi:hypothetical protein
MTELAVTRPPDPAAQLVAWADAARAAAGLAASLVQTNVCPPAFRGKPQEATAVVLLGAELGLSPIASLRSMYEIRGVIGMYVRSQVALVQSRGHRIWTVEETDDAVTVAGHRADDPEHVEQVTWTIARARQAGLIRRGSGNAPSQYETQPRVMLWSRAAGEVARRIAADVLAGIAEDDASLDAPQATSGQPATSGTRVQRAPRAQPRPVDVTELVDVELPPDEPQPAVVEGGSPSPQESPGHDDEPSDTLARDDDVDEIPPLVEDDTSDDEPLATRDQVRALQVLFVKAGVRGAEARHGYLTQWLGRPVTSTNDITVTEASATIDKLQRQVDLDG